MLHQKIPEALHVQHSDHSHIRGWVLKFLSWHTKATPNGKCCEGYIAPPMVRLMYQYQYVLKQRETTACFIMNVPILKPYISATTNPKWMKLVPRERPRPRVSYDCRQIPLLVPKQTLSSSVSKWNTASTLEWMHGTQRLGTTLLAPKIPRHDTTWLFLMGICNRTCLCSTITRWLGWAHKQNHGCSKACDRRHSQTCLGRIQLSRWFVHAAGGGHIEHL